MTTTLRTDPPRRSYFFIWFTAATFLVLGSAGLFVYLALARSTGSVTPLAGAAPDIVSDTWLNSAPEKMSALRGRVVLVEFWTLSCGSCRNLEPYIKQWSERYRSQGLEVISVHAPEFNYEREFNSVRTRVEQAAINYPVAIDNDYTNWNRYRNRAWPALYLVDKRGMLRHTKIGAGDYADTEQKIQALLQEAAL